MGLDDIKAKIANKEQQKREGKKNRWTLKAVVRESNYEVLLREMEASGSDTPSEVVNRALALMQRLMDLTGTSSFSEAVERSELVSKGITMQPVERASEALVGPSETLRVDSPKSVALDALDDLLSQD